MPPGSPVPASARRGHGAADLADRPGRSAAVGGRRPTGAASLRRALCAPLRVPDRRRPRRPGLSAGRHARSDHRIRTLTRRGPRGRKRRRPARLPAASPRPGGNRLQHLEITSRPPRWLPPIPCGTRFSAGETGRTGETACRQADGRREGTAGACAGRSARGAGGLRGVPVVGAVSGRRVPRAQGKSAPSTPFGS